MKKFIRLILAISLILSSMTFFGCDIESGTETKDLSSEATTEDETETKGSAFKVGSPSSLGASRWGREFEKNGVRFFIDNDGVLSTEVKDDGLTFLNIEYSSEVGNSQIITRWIAFDGNEIQFEKGTVLRAKVMTGDENAKEYSELNELIDQSVFDRFSSRKVEFFSMWLEAADGTELKIYDTALTFSVEEGSKAFLGAAFVSEKGDEILDFNHSNFNTPEGEKRNFLQIKLIHSGKSVALFSE